MKTKKSSIYIESYGCASSRYDSEIITGLLSEADYKIVSKPEDADIIILNTCIVKNPTEKKMRSRIRSLSHYHPNKKLIVTGCMPAAMPDTIRKIAPSASMVSTHNIQAIPDAVSKASKDIRTELLEKTRTIKPELPKIHSNPVVSITEICSGCSYSCSYCITRLAKGALFSYPAGKIVAQMKKDIDSGKKEFWLTGQSIAEYGRDIKSGLPELLNYILRNVKGEYYIRLGMMNPADVLPILNELIEIYKNKHIFKFLHLPVQSGSIRILKKMNRTYKPSDFIRIVQQFRKALPEITIWTDIIAGFPSETESDFIKTIQLLEKTSPDFVNISAYGARPYTRAAKMQQILKTIKKQRTKKALSLVNKLSLEQNRKWINWTGSVIVDEYNQKNKNWIARNYAYKPVILRGSFKYGDCPAVRITAAERTHLKAVLL